MRCLEGILATSHLRNAVIQKRTPHTALGGIIPHSMRGFKKDLGPKPQGSTKRPVFFYLFTFLAQAGIADMAFLWAACTGILIGDIDKASETRFNVKAGRQTVSQALFWQGCALGVFQREQELYDPHR